MDGNTQRGIARAPDHESASKMTEAMAPGAGSGGNSAMKVDNVSIRPAANGGFIVSCSKRPAKEDRNGIGPGYKSDDLAFSSLNEVIAYLQQELGDGATASTASTASGAIDDPAADDESEQGY